MKNLAKMLCRVWDWFEMWYGARNDYEYMREEDTGVTYRGEHLRAFERHEQLVKEYREWLSYRKRGSDWFSELLGGCPGKNLAIMRKCWLEESKWSYQKWLLDKALTKLEKKRKKRQRQFLRCVAGGILLCRPACGDF